MQTREIKLYTPDDQHWVKIEVKFETKNKIRTAISGEQLTNYRTLSFVGETRDSGGQIEDEIRLMFPDNPNVQQLCDYWDRWHLNDLKPGCIHQSDWSDQLIDPNKPKTQPNMRAWKPYKETLVRDDVVQYYVGNDGLLNRPCDICGYKYGTAWLVEDIPDNVISELGQLINDLQGDESICSLKPK